MSMSININQKILGVAKIAHLLESPQRRSRVTVLYREQTDEKEITLDRRKTAREGLVSTSSGSEFHSTATGNERRPTVGNWKGAQTIDEKRPQKYKTLKNVKT